MRSLNGEKNSRFSSNAFLCGSFPFRRAAILLQTRPTAAFEHLAGIGGGGGDGSRRRRPVEGARGGDASRSPIIPTRGVVPTRQTIWRRGSCVLSAGRQRSGTTGLVLLIPGRFGVSSFSFKGEKNTQVDAIFFSR